MWPAIAAISNRLPPRAAESACSARLRTRVTTLTDHVFQWQSKKIASIYNGPTGAAPNPFQQLAFETFQLSGYFDAIITGEDIERGKPDPEQYLLTAEKLCIPTSACMVIEDAISGVLSGKATGSFVVGITTSFTRNALVSADADLVVPSFSVLEDQIFDARRLAEDR